MTDNKRDTELTIRVKDLGTKSFREVASAISKVTGALDTQLVAAERGEVSAKSLRESINQLKDANKDLVKQQGLIDFYESLAVKLADSETKAQTARQAFEAFNASVKAGGAATKAQGDQLKSLETKATAAEGAVIRATARLEEQRAKLHAVGIDTANLVTQQQQLVTLNVAVERSLKIATDAYENYDAKLAATRDAEAALAAAQKAAQDSSRAASVRQDLAFQQQLETALESQKVATDALAAAEERRNAAARASNTRADLAFLQSLEAATERQEAAQKRLAAATALSGFQQIGADAVQAAGKIDIYTAAADRASPASSRIASSLNAILNPAREAVRTLDGLETKIGEVTKVIGEGKGSVHQYAEAFQDLERIQRQIVKTASDLDVFKDQARAVHQAEQAFEAAKADVIAYGNAVRTADEPNEELVASLKQAQAAMDSQERELTQQITKLRNYGAALKEAGVDVTNLANAEQRLTGVANATAAATVKLAGAASGKNGKIGTFLGLRPFELQNLSFQLNDVFTQIASGTSVSQTFAQQIGQIVQIFPRFFSALLPFAPLIIGVGLAVGVVVAAMRQLFDLEDSQRKFNGQLALMADGASISAASLAQTSHELDVFGTSLKETRQELQVFLKEGLDPSRFEDMGKAAQNLADITGKKVPEAAKELADGFTGGFKAIEKLNDEYDFLTAAELDEIELLFKQGDAAGALEKAYDKLSTKLQTGADASRNDWQVAVKNLSSAWDGLLHTLGNILPIQDATNFINSLAGSLRVLTDLIPKASKAQQDALNPGKAADPAKPKRGFGVLGLAGRLGDLATNAGAFVAKKVAPQKTDAIDKLVAKLHGVREAGVAAGNDTAAALGKTGNKAELAAAKIRKELIATLDKAKEKAGSLSDAKRLELAGIAAVTKAEEAGISDPKVLAEFRALGAEAEKQEINKEHARKSAAADRKAASAARKEEAAENKRLAIQSELSGQLRQIQIKVDKDQVVSLEDRLEAVDLQYEKIFETIEKLKKAGGKTIRGKSFVDFTAEVEAGKELLKQQEQLEFRTDQIAALEKQRGERLQTIKDEVAAGNLEAEKGFKQAQAVADELEPQIKAVAEAALAFAVTIRGATPDPKLEAFIDRMERLSKGTATKRTNSPVAKVGKDLLDEQLTDLNNLTEARDKVAENEQKLAELGLRSHVEAQDNIKAAYERTSGAINAQINSILALAKAAHDSGAISDIAFDGLITDMTLVAQGTQHIDENFTLLKTTITDQLVNGFTQAFDTVAQATANAIVGTGSWEDAIKSLGAAALNFTASFLKSISDVLVQIAVLQAIKNLPFLNGLTSGILDFTGLAAGAAALSPAAIALNTGAAGLTAAGPILTGAAATLTAAGGAFAASAPLLVASGPTLLTAATVLGASAAALQAAASTLLVANSVSLFHSGGTVGAGGSNRSRSVPASLFAGAPRYHSGTVVGFKPDEQAAILQNGEEVLDKTDPRNILNGGAAAGGNRGTGAAIGLRQILAIGDQEIANAMAGAAGDDVFLTKIQRFKSTIKAMLR
jgi:hypothetical protein